ncbi:MAG: diacylglycerol kinase [Pirellulales bacterium]|jgi:diacylglycerol kinase
MKLRRPPRSWTAKFRDAFRGVSRAIRSQSSFSVHLPAAAAVVVVAAVLNVSLVGWCLLVAAIGMVLAAEIFNTAIESLARSLGPRRHPRIRDALDIASGGVLCAAATAAVIGVLVLGERAGSLLGWW